MARVTVAPSLDCSRTSDTQLELTKSSGIACGHGAGIASAGREQGQDASLPPVAICLQPCSTTFPGSLPPPLPSSPCSAVTELKWEWRDSVVWDRLTWQRG